MRFSYIEMDETSIHSELQNLLCTMGTMCAKYAFGNPKFCLCRRVEVHDENGHEL